MGGPGVSTLNSGEEGSEGNMNIRRGMLRLWIAVSALWLAVVCAAFSDQLSEIFTAIEPPEG